MTRPPKDTRVIVRRCGHASGGCGSIVFVGGVPGTVYRPRRCDEGAWVRLDERSDAPNAHPFPADDERGRDVLAYPEDYEVIGDGGGR